MVYGVQNLISSYLKWCNSIFLSCCMVRENRGTWICRYYHHYSIRTLFWTVRERSGLILCERTMDKFSLFHCSLLVSHSYVYLDMDASSSCDSTSCWLYLTIYLINMNVLKTHCRRSFSMDIIIDQINTVCKFFIWHIYRTHKWIKF